MYRPSVFLITLKLSPSALLKVSPARFSGALSAQLMIGARLETRLPPSLILTVALSAN